MVENTDPYNQLLRRDLEVREHDDGCSVLDPLTGESYEFGALECCLIKAIRDPYDVDLVLRDCNALFDAEISEQDFHEFLDLLAGWSLLESADGGKSLSRSEESESSQIFREQLNQPNRLHLFNPEGLLDGINTFLGGSVKYLWWPLTPLLLITAATAFFANIDPVLDELSRSLSEVNRIVRMLVYGSIVGLISHFARGLMARRYGLETPSLGIALYGFLPRFNMQMNLHGAQERHQRMWLSAIMTISRLWMIALALLFWLMTHASGSTLSLAMMEIVLVSLIGLFFTANPLLPGDGANFVSAWLEVPDLHKRSSRALKGLFVKQPAVIIRHTKHRFAFALFGFLSLALILLLVGFILSRVFMGLEGHFHGTGVAIFILVLGIFSWRIFRRKKRRQEQIKQRYVSTPGQPQQERDVPGGRNASARPVAKKRKSSVTWQRILLAVLTVIVLALPYHYETGGDAELLPVGKATLSFGQNGIIEHIYVTSGEFVQKGSKLASIGNSKQQKDLGKTRADIKSREYDILQYQTTPSREELDLAIADVASAKLQLRYSLEDLKRQQHLFNKKLISEEEYESAKKDADLKKDALKLARLQLAATRAQINPNQISSLEADVEGLKQDEAYYQHELSTTTLYSPIEGRVVTQDLSYKLKSYVTSSDVVIEVQDTSEFIVRIAIPETDIGVVKPGNVIRLKLWGAPGKEITGKVDSIELTAEDQSFGKVVYIRSKIHNNENELVSGLTGYAKVSGYDTIVLVAFSRAIVRFFTIEAWSWLP